MIGRDCERWRNPISCAAFWALQIRIFLLVLMTCGHFFTVMSIRHFSSKIRSRKIWNLSGMIFYVFFPFCVQKNLWNVSKSCGDLRRDHFFASIIFGGSKKWFCSPNCLTRHRKKRKVKKEANYKPKSGTKNFPATNLITSAHNQTWHRFFHYIDYHFLPRFLWHWKLRKHEIWFNLHLKSFSFFCFVLSPFWFNLLWHLFL